MALAQREGNPNRKKLQDKIFSGVFQILSFILFAFDFPEQKVKNKSSVSESLF
jgi:hypothetical protein